MPLGYWALVMVINSALFGFTLMTFDVTPAQEVNPLTNVYCFDVAKIATTPSSPVRAMQPKRCR
jgi:hypothetical protein